uniref:CCHC-type domain-containing protein n=1 Tax=Cacopsylla melanoneura TaxID=428564 RepID=A0A8D8Z0P6_9HEMI
MDSWRTAIKSCCRAAEEAKQKTDEIANGQAHTSTPADEVMVIKRQPMRSNQWSYQSSHNNGVSSQGVRSTGSYDNHPRTISHESPGPSRSHSIPVPRSARNNYRQAYKPRNECGRCLRSHESNNCPAYGRHCFRCGRMNHFDEACRLRPKKIKAIEIEESSSDQEGGELTKYLISTVQKTRRLINEMD